MIDDVQAQRDYYARTAEHYDAMHVSEGDEHTVALAAFCGLATLRTPASILDIGAGTGRAVTYLQARWPQCRVVGVEPVAALRAVGHERGIAPDVLIEGDVLKLDFADDAFDYVIQTGVLHHVADPAAAVAEMMRVARVGIMLSDSNRYGQGSRPARIAKDVLRRLRLWRPFIYAQTRGRMSKWSEGDGLYYSYSLFDNLAQIRRKFPRVTVMNTQDIDGTDARFGSAHAMIFALKD
jgi:SAM-dependent methyltransferase